MAEYIDRETALNALQARIKLSDECLPFFKEYLSGVNDRIKAIPSADVVERKHGKRVNGNCSVCGGGRLCYGDRSFCSSPFCPWCGADMREVEGKE